jgi:2-phospho-L-lactate guanylyltransferase (CobY/MobA/RfbA family)
VIDVTTKPMTIAAFRQWRTSKATAIPWAELEATVIEVAALEQILKDSPEPVLKRAIRAEMKLDALETRMRLVLADLMSAAPEGLKEAIEAAIRDMRTALKQVVTTKEKR